MLKYRDKLTKLEYKMGKNKGPERPVRSKTVDKPMPVDKVKEAKKAALTAAHLKARGDLKSKASNDRVKFRNIFIDARYDASKFKNDYSKPYPNGEFSDAEKAFRTQRLEEGLIVRYDVGLNFYRVQPGDNLDGIKDKLSKYENFSYLKNLPKGKIKTFNISAGVLKPGMWLALPPQKSPVEGLTDAKFIENCRDAIKEIQSNPIYGRFVVDLLRRTTEDQVVAMMLACAKTESGSGRLDQFALFRYQAGSHKCYSYTLFHILMDGAGLKARQNLGMTEGQTLEPKNSAKLFLAFMIEKAPDTFQKLFPLDGNTKKFATFYNGNWEFSAKQENLRIDKRNAKRKKGEEIEPHVEDYPTRLGKNLDVSKAMLKL